MTPNAKAAGVRTHGKPLLKRIWDYRVIYLMLLPTVLYFVLFKCRAVWGMKLAFFDYRPRGEDVWAGLKYFQQVFSSPTFGTIILNTVKISLMRTLLNWFFPVVFALMQHEVRRSGFRKTVQVVSYLPHFLSWVVIYGIWKGALDYGGMLNGIYNLLGIEYKNLLLRSDTIVGVIGASSLWRGIGWDSIIYLAAILAIDTTLFDAATVDGASKWYKLFRITLPSILPTIMIMRILRMGAVFSVGYEKIMLMYNEATYETADVISTYLYRRAFKSGDYSFSAAVGLFNSVINFTIIQIFNKISAKVSEVSLW